MYRRVLVPLDGSPVAETVVPFMMRIAGPLDCEVVLLRVIPAVRRPGAGAVGGEDIDRVDAEEYLAPLAAELRGTGVRVRTCVRRGQPAEEIVAAAAETDADLIAMTTRGRGGPGLGFGSVAEVVLRRAALPVLLMRATEGDVERRAKRQATA